MPSKEKRTMFFLGATGFLGSQFLVLLARSFPDKFHVVALVRSPIHGREAGLKAIYDDLSIVEGTLDDDDKIQEQVITSDIVINCASSDHTSSVQCKPFV